jgi:hypothetical protein
MKQSDDSKWCHNVITHVNDTKWRHKVMIQSVYTKWWTNWFQKAMTLSDDKSVITKSDDINFWHQDMTQYDDTKWWHKVMIKRDDTNL